MKKILAFILLVLVCLPAFAANVIDDFEKYHDGDFPSSWRTWPFQRGKAEQIYKVASENGNKYLHADDAAGLSIQIMRNFDWNLSNYPKFSWKWRAKKLPVGAVESDPEKNDSACGVYVVISKARQEMMKYVWSTTLPVGTVYEKKPGKAYIIVADTGPSKLNTWQTHTVNVAEDYKKYFKKDLDKEPAGIAVLTDSNATLQGAACDYDDFTLMN
jgi:hypothetical protein